MNERTAEALAERLRGLHLPEPVGWWPPAPGWWIVTAAVLLSALALALRGRGGRRARAPTLCEALDSCFADWRRDRDTARYHERVAGMLRRAAIARAGDAHVARLAGRRWAEWLAASAPLSTATRSALADGRYRREPPQTVPEVHAELRRCAAALERDASDDA